METFRCYCMLTEQEKLLIVVLIDCDRELTLIEINDYFIHQK